jgi:multiple sugar transport system ATP-binding protein
VKVAPWSEGAGRPAQVYEVEPLGGYTVLTLDAGATRFRALLRGEPAIRPEALVAVSCDPSRVHYFNASGDAIVR